MIKTVSAIVVCLMIYVLGFVSAAIYMQSVTVNVVVSKEKKMKCIPSTVGGKPAKMCTRG